MTFFRSLIVIGALCVVGPPLAGQIPPAGDPAPSWEELRARPYPPWFVDAKLGIFIHWGVYSVPSYSGKEDYAEWFVRGLQVGDTLRTRFLRENYGEDFHYRDFAPLFRAELFDPDEWAQLFRRSGARYVVMVSKHHDGYAMWPSRYSPGWNSMDVGPGRDLVGELTESVRDAGLRMGLYYSLAEWTNPLHRWYADPPDSIGRYVDEHMIPQFKELVGAYRPVVLFSDGEWLNSAEQWHARELIDWYYDTVGPDAIVNDRWGGGSDVGFKTPEYSAGITLTDRPWAEVRGLGRSFALNRNEALDAYMTPDELVHAFARAVAAGGGMILNVGPKADGQIPLLQQERLVQLGEWLETNGEAIYGSRPWSRIREMKEVTLERTDPVIDFDFRRNGPGRPIREDHFTATWTGVVTPRFSEEYTFEADADDAMRVWVDGVLVASVGEMDEAEKGSGDPAGDAASPAADAVHMELPAPEAAPPRPIRLEAGRSYPIRIEYLEREVNAWARLYWSSASQAREIVGGEFHALYRSQQERLVYTTKGEDLFAISFEWPDGELALPIPAPEAGTRVTLLGRDGTLPWRYENDTLYVDLSNVPYSQIPGRWAWTVKLGGYLDASG